MKLIYQANTVSPETHPHTVNKAKSLIKVLGSTAIEHNLEQTENLFDEIIIAIGFDGNSIRQKLGSSFNQMPIKYIEVSPQADINEIVSCCENSINDNFVILTDGWIYSSKEIARCIKAGRSKLTLNSCECGAYHLYRSDIEKINRYGFESVAGELPCLEVEDYCLRFSYPWHILEANVFLLNRFDNFANHGTVEQGAVIKGNVYIGKRTVIKSFCYIEGPAFIDDDCTIGPFAYIRKDSIIGKGVHIGRMEVFDAVLMDGFTSKHNSYAGHSVIGEKSNFGAGTITSDYRHDGGNHITLINGEKVDTKRKKLGAFLGDFVTTGIGTLIYPGRKIWPHGGTLPGEVVKIDKVL